jgi:hypothetical protein
MEALVHIYTGSKMGLTDIKSVLVLIQHVVIQTTIKPSKINIFSLVTRHYQAYIIRMYERHCKVFHAKFEKEVSCTYIIITNVVKLHTIR